VAPVTRILLISGSTRDDSLHTAAMHTAARSAPAGITATRYDGLRDLPPFIPADEAPTPGPVQFLRFQVGGADAVLFCTPEYAGSLPGSLKNLLDWLIGSGSLDGMPAAWLSVAAPGQDDGARAALETVLAHCGARLVRPACIRVPLTPDAIDARGTIDDMQLHTALLDVLHGLARSTVPAAPSDQPSWQAYSSVFPVVMRQRPQRPHHPWHHQGS
jgi:chromate reductase